MLYIYVIHWACSALFRWWHGLVDAVSSQISISCSQSAFSVFNATSTKFISLFSPPRFFFLCSSFGGRFFFLSRSPKVGYCSNDLATVRFRWLDLSADAIMVSCGINRYSRFKIVWSEPKKKKEKKQTQAKARAWISYACTDTNTKLIRSDPIRCEPNQTKPNETKIQSLFNLSIQCMRICSKIRFK